MVSNLPNENRRNFHMIHWKAVDILSIRFYYLSNVSYQYDCMLYPQWLPVHPLIMKEISPNSLEVTRHCLH